MKPQQFTEREGQGPPEDPGRCMSALLRQTVVIKWSLSARLLFWLTFPPLAYSVSRLREGKMSVHICESTISLRAGDARARPCWERLSPTERLAARRSLLKQTPACQMLLPIRALPGIYQNAERINAPSLSKVLVVGVPPWLNSAWLTAIKVDLLDQRLFSFLHAKILYCAQQRKGQMVSHSAKCYLFIILFVLIFSHCQRHKNKYLSVIFAQNMSCQVIWLKFAFCKAKAFKRLLTGFSSASSSKPVQEQK